MTWRSEAACADTDPEVFFLHAAGPRGRVTNRSKALALATCAGCGVTTECLEYALSTPEAGDFGIWGGFTRSQRIKMRRGREVIVLPYIPQVYEQQTPTAPIQDKVCTKSLQEAVKM